MTSSYASLKTIVRKQALAARDQISKGDRKTRSTQICNELLLHVKRQAGECARLKEQEAKPLTPFTVAVYYAMKSEVDLKDFISQAYYCGWTVCFPCMVARTQDKTEKTVMKFYAISQEQLPKAARDFLLKPTARILAEKLEQAGYPEIPSHQIDAVVCPLVAFDSRRARLGYGGGNYDRFLSKCSPHTMVVGVAFSEQEVPLVPQEEHDLTLPTIIKA